MSDFEVVQRPVVKRTAVSGLPGWRALADAALAAGTGKAVSFQLNGRDPSDAYKCISYYFPSSSPFRLRYQSRDGVMTVLAEKREPK